MRDGLQIIQGVVRVGADTTRNSPIGTPRDTSPERGGDGYPANGEAAHHPAISALKEAEAGSAGGSGSSTPVQISQRPGIIGFMTQAELGYIVRDEDEGVSENMVRWAEKLPLETLVLVEGRVQSPQADSGGEHDVVRSGNVHNAEIEVFRVSVSFLVCPCLILAASPVSVCMFRRHQRAHAATFWLDYRTLAADTMRGGAACFLSIRR